MWPSFFGKDGVAAPDRGSVRHAGCNEAERSSARQCAIAPRQSNGFHPFSFGVAEPYPGDIMRIDMKRCRAIAVPEIAARRTVR